MPGAVHVAWDKLETVTRWLHFKQAHKLQGRQLAVRSAATTPATLAYQHHTFHVAGL